MAENRSAFLKRGHILVIIGGGITGNIQINDTHCHAPLKAFYREEEVKLMLQQLQDNPNKIPSPSRNEMIAMLVKSWKQLEINVEQGFKSLFVTNALDGSEDFLVSHKLFSLIGSEMIQFQYQLSTQRPIKSLEEVIHRLIPAKGIRRRNVEGLKDPGRSGHGSNVDVA
eukprot:gene1085-423_t